MHHEDMARREPYPAGLGRPARPPQRSRRHVARVVSALGWGLTGLVGFAVYANVLSDDTALRARTAQLVRQHAGCSDGCRITQTEIHRSVLEYRADYEIEGVGTIRVTCGRKGVAIGEQECRVR
jgi:hypothetical protein